ncbi:5-formyltetrahydrofolate cyclo-ligase [Thalassotalea sp. 42_200_T64]|nr:5-formyltetrahydrofolate cyclo-ligase [Thalassotalea sp. 42_200_T64]
MDQRNTLRKIIRNRRQQLSVHEQHIAATHIKDRLVRHHKVQSANTIALYLANDGELDLNEFIAWCFSNNKQVYLPVLHPFCPGHLLFLHYSEHGELVKNKYQIPEPKLDVTKVLPLSQLDVLITPLVAFDNEGNRLGMGGGFYDRTLAHWQKVSENGLDHAANPYPIGVAHKCQQVDKVPTEHWDIPIPEIFTPH